MYKKRDIEPKYRDFVDLLDFSNGKYNIGDVFRDFVCLFAISLSNALLPDKSRENLYQSTLNKYEKKEMQIFPRLAVKLIELLEKEGQPYDILGDIFGQIGIGDKRLGQFFTPFNLSLMMGKMTAPKEITIKTHGKKYETFSEPACR